MGGIRSTLAHRTPANATNASSSTSTGEWRESMVMREVESTTEAEDIAGDLQRLAKPEMGPLSNLTDATNASSSASTSEWRESMLNDSVYELHMPSTPPSVEILFFHGLQLQENQDIHIVTWKSTCSDRVIWPKQWLPEDFPTARVLSMFYDGSIEKTHTRGQMDMHLITENLLQCLLLANVGQAQPVILIGHSFGGLVIKALCLHAHRQVHLPSDGSDRIAAFLQNIKGIFYYSTPHRGSEFMDVVEKLDMKEGDLVKFARVFSKDMGRLNQEFENLQYGRWLINGVGETKETDLGGGKYVLIVREASARCDNFCGVSEDHFSICQPRDKKSLTYQKLIHFIRKVISEDGSTTEGEDVQRLPKTQVGPLSKLADGEIFRRLEKHSALGLWGTGGVGKTTLAKAIFNHLHSTFEFTLFVESVKNIVGDEKDLEKKILGELHHRGKKVDGSIQTGRSPLGLLTGKRLLLVLDDVEGDGETNIASKLQERCSASSRVILTSRDRLILNKVEGIDIVEVDCLDAQSSEKLFRSYVASNGKVLSSKKEQCLEGIVKHSGGLPLILVVLGAYLKDIPSKETLDAVWEETLRALVEADSGIKEIDSRIWSKLRISYDSLDKEAKEMFLDVATLFQGKVSWEWQERRWRLCEAKAVWKTMYDGKGELRWKQLVDRALVSDIPDDSEIKLHEHLLKLGQQLVGNVKENKRIITTDVTRLLEILPKNSIQIEKLHSISLWKEDTKAYFADENSTADSLHSFIERIEKMKKLRYLQLQGYQIPTRDGEMKLPHNTIVFGNTIYNSISFVESSKLVVLAPFTLRTSHISESFFKLENLQILHLEASILEYLPDSFHHLKSLKICRLTCELLKKLPTSFGTLENLYSLVIECRKLESFPESFGSLGNLQTLGIKNCERLESFPESFGSLDKLQTLRIENCERFESFSESFGSLGNLQTLGIKSCATLESFPESFGSLGNLQTLWIGSCQRLKSFPESFGSLGNLQSLGIKSCATLESFPESFGSLGNLQTLRIESCERLKSFPESFGSLGNLQTLGIKGCERFESFPKYFGSLGNLQTLWIGSCQRLESFPESFGSLGNLQSLGIKICERFESFPESFGSLRKLQTLQIESCERLESFPESFGFLGNLQTLRIESCERLESFPETFSSLGNLQTLEIKSCGRFETFPESFGFLGNLQILRIESCERFESFPESFGSLGNLQTLGIKSCGRFESFPESFGSLGKLQTLWIGSCQRLKSFPESFGSLGNLQSLGIKLCERLESFPESFGSLGNLQTLRIESCKKLESFPESFGSLGNLQTLGIKSCATLESFPESFGFLGKLQTLWIGSCQRLGSLPESFGSLGNLQTLEFKICESLEKFPESFGSLGKLQTLRIESCERFESFPESFGSLGNLQTLGIKSCGRLESFPESFGSLRNLQTLWIGSCKKLESFPESFGFLGNLKSLGIKSCERLESFPESFGSLGKLQILQIESCKRLESFLESFGSLGNLQNLIIKMG